MIKAARVSLKYPGGTVALKEIDLSIGSGEIVYVTGPSGSGKTSLLKLFMGIEYPTSGSMEILGQPITKGRASGIRGMRRRIGPIFQEFKLIDGRTAMENVIMGMRFLDFSPGQARENADEALVKVGLKDKRFSLVENLSWGERQRVAIARAVARKPALILADEPTGNLDRGNALNIMDLLSSFKDKNTSVIITTHATHLISGEKDARLLTIDKGSISWERIEQVI